jgi:hypothetical protein
MAGDELFEILYEGWHYCYQYRLVTFEEETISIEIVVGVN